MEQASLVMLQEVPISAALEQVDGRNEVNEVGTEKYEE